MGSIATIRGVSPIHNGALATIIGDGCVVPRRQVVAGWWCWVCGRGGRGRCGAGIHDDGGATGDRLNVGNSCDAASSPPIDPAPSPAWTRL